ncbi:MAG: Lrp/AsnC family transcriptional regulator [Candidatus Bathyarchaeota archaeon]|nr:Lrp/AsnC family transcriptional regulator [Candidatus Bathyarchaeota archaeon]
MIDSLDSKIIDMLQKDGQIAFAKIAERLKVSPRTVQIHYAKMKKTGLIKGTTLILDLPRIRTSIRYTVNIGVNAVETDLEDVAKYVSSLKINNTVVHKCWITFGRYNMTVGLGSTNLLDVHKIKQMIMQHPSVKTASININRYFWESGIKTEFAAGAVPQVVLDKVDYELLRILSKDARAPLKQISETLAVSDDTVCRRLERLKQKRIILGSTVVLSSKACGYQGLCAFYIKTKAGSNILNAAEKLMKIPAAISVFYLIGEYDFNVNVHFREYEDIATVVSKIRKIEEVSLFDTVWYLSQEWSIPFIFNFEIPRETFYV